MTQPELPWCIVHQERHIDVSRLCRYLPDAMAAQLEEVREVPAVWFDHESVVDGVVSVFGPTTSRLEAGQAVFAITKAGDRYEATVLHVTPMPERDLAGIRLGEQKHKGQGASRAGARPDVGERGTHG